MKKNVMFAAFLAGTMCLSLCFTSCEGKGGTKSMKNSVDSLSYAYGVGLGDNLAQNLSSFPAELNMDLFMQAFEKTIKGQIEDLSIQPEQAYQIFQSCLMVIQQESAQKNKDEAVKFLEENAGKEGVVTTESGLQYEVLLAADGPKPKETDRVSVHYHGTLIDGTVFDSSVDRGEPAQFALNGVIPGWTEGIQLMSVGSKYKFYLPAELAYGDNGAGDVIQPGAMLIFEVELLEILK
ncbi:MAG: FKBP-type peptidyl-prolyl cis-trans isomerase [Bacteroidales bacterium]|jgi:FKBP-type peptidyl-prolyl cis-trans isomerase|nr:FKBP-type peptidyl-prolyl cis-trans isomerase [Bacteroidales bacterium]